MNDDFPFLRTIAERPDDDGPRLVFADWLEERGDPYAEFIRLQIELRRGPQEVELVRAQELFEEYWREWLAPVCAALDEFSPLERSPRSNWLRYARPSDTQRWLEDLSHFRWGYLRTGEFGVVHHVRTWAGESERLREATFAGGFADSLTLAAWGALSGDHLRRLAEVSPLRRLRIDWRTPADWRKLDGPHFASLCELSLRYDGKDIHERAAELVPMVRAVCESPHLAALRSFGWENRGQTGAAMSALRDSLLGERLDELAVPNERSVLDAVRASGITTRLPHASPRGNLMAYSRRSPPGLSG